MGWHGIWCLFIVTIEVHIHWSVNNIVVWNEITGCIISIVYFRPFAWLQGWPRMHQAKTSSWQQNKLGGYKQCFHHLHSWLAPLAPSLWFWNERIKSFRNTTTRVDAIVQGSPINRAKSELSRQMRIPVLITVERNRDGIILAYFLLIGHYNLSQRTLICKELFPKT